MSEINNTSTVTMHYTLRLEDGSIADSSKNYDAPAIVKLDDGTLQPAFVDRLLGLKTGSKAVGRGGEQCQWARARAPTADATTGSSRSIITRCDG